MNFPIGKQVIVRFFVICCEMSVKVAAYGRGLLLCWYSLLVQPKPSVQLNLLKFKLRTKV